jgi:hypothetical protein
MPTEPPPRWAKVIAVGFAVLFLGTGLVCGAGLAVKLIVWVWTL